MSIYNLSYSLIKIFGIRNSSGDYGEVKHTKYVKYTNTPARISYMSGLETVEVGKEIVTPTHLIQIGSQLDIDETDVVEDDLHNTYDILIVNTCWGKHMELTCKKVTQITEIDEIPGSSSSSSSSRSSSSHSSSSKSSESSSSDSSILEL